MIYRLDFYLESLNSYLNIFSIIGIIAASGVLFFSLLKQTDKWERLLLGVIFFSSGFMRFVFGSFAPWRQHSHYVEIFSNLQSNLYQTGLLSITRMYHASGGLFEMFYDIPLQIIGEFNVYTIYYTSLAIHLIAGLLVFKLALNLFKRKEVAFISYLVFAFLPILINISASELVFHINVLTILLFANYLFHFFQKYKNNKAKWHHYFLLLSLFTANLLGRYEYLMIFIGAVLALTSLTAFKKKLVNEKIIKSKADYILLMLASLILIFAFYYHLWPIITAEGEFGYRWSSFVNLKLHLNSFRYFSNANPSHAPFLRSFYTPLYFFALLVVTPFVLIFKKRFWLIVLNITTIILMSFVIKPSLADFRRVMPFLIFLTPQIGYAFYLVLYKIRIPSKKILALATFIIILSTYQNSAFLNMETARKVEQEFLIKNIERVPKDSLLITINSGDYRHIQQAHLFEEYLIPDDKNIKVTDLYEYMKDDSGIADQYESIYYYRSLRAYHEINLKSENGVKNPQNISSHEASKLFERTYALSQIDKKKTINRLTDSYAAKNYAEGVNRTVKSGDYKKLEIVLFKLSDS